MATKKELLKNLRKFSPEEIAGAVRTGEVSLYELSKETEGAFTPLLKKKVKTILEKPTPVSQAPVQEQVVINPVPEVHVANSVETNESMANEPTDYFHEVADNTINNEETNTVEEPEVTISNKGMFKRPFSFCGRIRRTEYGISYIMYFIWNVILNVAVDSNETPLALMVFLLITYIPMVWFMLAQNCKRCHDRGNSGWYQLIPFYFLVLLFGDGEKGSNNYGDNPK